MDGKSPRVCRSFGMPLVGILLLGADVLAAEPQERGEVRVARLIRNLADTNFSNRQSADDELARLGSQTRAQLEQALKHDDVEVRLRAKRLLDRLDLEQLWAGSRIEITAHDQQASKVLASLAEQSGNHVHIGDPYGSFNEKKLDVDYHDTPYWQVIDELCQKTGNRARPHYDMHTPGIVVSAGTPGNFPRAYAGPVRAQITTARRMFIEELSYEESKAELTHSFQCTLQLTWEDRFRIVGYATQPELVEAVTDNHAIVSATQPGGGGWSATSRGLRQVTGSLKLNPVPISAKKLDTFKIKWGLIAMGEPATLEITQPQEDQSYAQDDVSLRVEGIEWQSASKYIVTVGVVRDMALPEPAEVLFQEYELEVTDAEGRAFRTQNQSHAITDKGVQLKLTVIGDSAESKPQSLKLRYPRLRAKRDVVLTFRDVPLPVSRPEE
jgi:hypothetical protein